MPTKPRPFLFEKQYKYFRLYVPKHDRSEGTIWRYTEAPIGDL